jgi:hypothetical protein
MGRERLDQLSDCRVAGTSKEWREQSKNSMTVVNELALHSLQKGEKESAGWKKERHAAKRRELAESAE